MKIVTYNVNGIRAANRLGIVDWIKSFDADIYCLQEIRADEGMAKEILDNIGYNVIYNPAKKKGYSGSAILSKIKPDKYIFGLNDDDAEGRTITAIFGDIAIINCYVPNGGVRLEFKLYFFEKLTSYLVKLNKKYKVIFCSDTNIAFDDNDVSHPKLFSKRTGFLPIERELLSDMFNSGFVDTYRYIYPEGKAYSWRSYRSRTIGGDFGWKYRFDYIIIDKDNANFIKDVQILDLDYSDHLPVVAELKL